MKKLILIGALTLAALSTHTTASANTEALMQCGSIARLAGILQNMRQSGAPEMSDSGSALAYTQARLNKIIEENKSSKATQDRMKEANIKAIEAAFKWPVSFPADEVSSLANSSCLIMSR